MRRKLVAFAVVALVSLALGIIVSPATGLYDETVRVVSSAGTVLNGTASAVTGLYDKTVRIVNSSNQVIDSFGSGATPYPTPTALIFGTFSPIPLATATPNAGTPLIYNGTNISGQIDAEGTITNAGTVTCGTVSNHIWNTCQFTIASGAAITVANPTNLPTNAVVWLAATNAGTSTGAVTWGTNFLVWSPTTGNFVALSTLNGSASMLQTGVAGDTESIPFWSDGTLLKLITPRAISMPNLSAFNIQLSGDSGTTQASMARTALTFTEGSQGSIVSNSSMGTYLTVRAITIENIILDIGISPTCSVSEQITCFDCGTSAGACTAGQTSTIMSAITIASGATRQSISETVNTANVAAGHYISCLETAGTCTVSNNSINMMTRPQ